MTDNGTAAVVNLDQQGHVLEGFNDNMRGKKGSEYEGGHRCRYLFDFPVENTLRSRASVNW